MVAERPYMVIQITVSQREAQAVYGKAPDRDTREARLKDYLETLGLRPRHGSGTIEWWSDPEGLHHLYRQTIPREERR